MRQVEARAVARDGERRHASTTPPSGPTLNSGAGAKGGDDFIRAEMGAGGEGQTVVDYTGSVAVRTGLLLTDASAFSDDANLRVSSDLALTSGLYGRFSSCVPTNRGGYRSVRPKVDPIIGVVGRFSSPTGGKRRRVLHLVHRLAGLGESCSLGRQSQKPRTLTWNTR